MIVKCAFCNGLMKVAGETPASKQWIKIRCPHCFGVGLVGNKPPTPEVEAPEPKIPGKTPLLPRSREVDDADEYAGAFEPEDGRTQGSPEEEYLFPAEQNNFRYDGTVESKGIRIFLWIMASLIVILFFALLVNFILPGPLR